MTNEYNFQNQTIFKKIKLLSNPARFKVLELTQGNGIPISEIGKKLGIKYKRCSEYIRKMEKEGLLYKTVEGRIKIVKSNAELRMNAIIFDKKN